MRSSVASPPTVPKDESWLARRRHQLGGAWALARLACRLLIAPWPPFAAFLVVAAVVGGVTPLVQIYATTGLIDTLTARTTVPTLPSDRAIPSIPAMAVLLAPYLPWLGLLVGAMTLNWLVNNHTFQGYLAVQLNERVRPRFDALLFGKVRALQLEWFESPTYYDTLHRARGLMSGGMVTYYLSNAQTLVARALGCLGILLALVAVHPAFPLALLVGTGLVLRVRMERQRHIIKMYTGQTPARRRQAYWRSLLVERGPAAEVRLFGLGDHVIREWRKLAEQMLGETVAALRHNFGLTNQINVVNQGLHGLVILALLYAGMTGRLSIGALVALLYAVQRYLNWVSDMTSQINELQRFAAELHYVADFLALPQEESPSGAEVPALAPEGIRFAGVSFHYPNGDRAALKSVDLQIHPGERIALVGENGAGKTTLAKLLMGLYQPTEGRISVGSVPLSTIAPRAWREKVGAVFQDYARFSLSVRDNIGFGRLAKLEDAEAIAAAARRSAADEMFAGLPDGYETALGKEFPGGRDLSRGEWQKLALARAYLRDAEILILDEPASALDPLAELAVYRQFVSLSAGKTVILISHRLGSARLADRIVFLSQGRVIEEGTHDELVARRGPYAELYELQAEWYRERAAAKSGQAGEGEAGETVGYSG